MSCYPSVILLLSFRHPSIMRGNVACCCKFEHGLRNVELPRTVPRSGLTCSARLRFRSPSVPSRILSGISFPKVGVVTESFTSECPSPMVPRASPRKSRAIERVSCSPPVILPLCFCYPSVMQVKVHVRKSNVSFLILVRCMGFYENCHILWGLGGSVVG